MHSLNDIKASFRDKPTKLPYSNIVLTLGLSCRCINCFYRFYFLQYNVHLHILNKWCCASIFHCTPYCMSCQSSARLRPGSAAFLALYNETGNYHTKRHRPRRLCCTPSPYSQYSQYSPAYFSITPTLRRWYLRCLLVSFPFSLSFVRCGRPVKHSLDL